jgi:flagellar biosynthesis/type III secretory pathway chaperone
MTQTETETLLKTADDCAEGECSLDDVDELISVLQQQQKELSERVHEVQSMMTQLEKVNTHNDRKVDEVRETVRAIFRLFQMGNKSSGNDYPSLSKPTGWSGEVGDGPKSAYDALPPKKWTAPKK